MGSRFIVIDYLQSKSPLSKTAVAYIYFDCKNKDTHNILSVFCSILRQLLERINQIPQEIQRFYDSLPSERKENTVERAAKFASIFVTSRPQVNLTLELNDCAYLEVRATDSDMCAYLKARTADHKVLRRIVDHSPALEDYLVDTICKKANGM